MLWKEGVLSDFLSVSDREKTVQAHREQVFPGLQMKLLGEKEQVATHATLRYPTYNRCQAISNHELAPRALE